MRWTRMILLVTVLGGCATAPPPMPQEVRAQVQRTMDAFASMNLEAFKAGLTEDVVGFDFDLEGKPVRLGSREDAVRYAEEMFAAVKKMGATMKLDIQLFDCRPSSALAYCIVEFDFKATMADGSAMVQPTRNSFVLRKGDDGWKWTHWHSSLSVLPASPASAPAP